MGWDDDDWGQDTGSASRTYTHAQAAVDLEKYLGLKRTISVRSLVLVGIAALLTVRWFPVPAVALATGGVGGVINALLTMRSGERLVDSGRKAGFVLSSFLRIGLFGIVPVVFAAKGPWWSMAWYFVGFFLPLVLYAIAMQRTFGRE